MEAPEASECGTYKSHQMRSCGGSARAMIRFQHEYQEKTSSDNKLLNKRPSKKYLSLSPRLRGSIVTLIQMGGTYIRQRTPRRERADQCG
jgi:hypothetical protein